LRVLFVCFICFVCFVHVQAFRHRADELVLPGVDRRTVWQEWEHTCKASCDFLHPSLDKSSVLSVSKQITLIAEKHKHFVTSDDLALLVLESLKYAVPLRCAGKSERQPPWVLKGCDLKEIKWLCTALAGSKVADMVKKPKQDKKQNKKQP